MFEHITKVLANISVKSKLAAGFALVLLLTVMIAVTGWLSVGALSERGQ